MNGVNRINIDRTAKSGKSDVSIVLIAAVDEVNGIGLNGGIPWTLPEDRAFFRVQTLGHPVIMGGVTYRSIGKPLSQRPCAVWSRDSGLLVPDSQMLVSADLNELVEWCTLLDREIYVIGGQSVYESMLERATDILLSRVCGRYDCDRFFPLFHGFQRRQEIAFKDFSLEHWIR